MNISYNWLKWYIPEIPEAEKLHDIFTYHLTEVESIQTREDGDTIFDLNILPNRAHDLLSHQGIAKELSGQLGIKFNDPTEMYKLPETKKTNLQIEIKSDKCRRYMGRIIRNVKVGPSPDWVVKHLESIGQRSINNIVDATNIVMYDCGQPVHAYDLVKLSGEKIVITNAKEGEELPVVGRDAVVAKLKDTDLVITDGEKSLALAGVKGGLDSGISDTTTDIILEVANFDSTSIRKTARRLNLLSDSAKRFENDLSPEHCSYAMRELSALFLDPAMNCSSAVFEEIVDVYSVKQEDKKISFTTEMVNKKLGSSVTDNEIEKILQNYGYGYLNDFQNNKWTVNIPPLRLDLNIPEDMVEEIGRIIGYDKILPVIPEIKIKNEDDKTFVKTMAVRNYLLSEGYSEVMNYSLVKKGQYYVARGPKGKDALRTNLEAGFKESIKLNNINLPVLGMDDVKIFEIGNVFTESGEETHVVWGNTLKTLEVKIEDFPEDNLNTNIKIENTNTDKKFVAWSPYPMIVRDLSLWVLDVGKLDEISNFILNFKHELVPVPVRLIDSFNKEGKQSLAFRFVFQSKSETLQNEMASDIFGDFVNNLQKLYSNSIMIR